MCKGNRFWMFTTASVVSMFLSGCCFNQNYTLKPSVALTGGAIASGSVDVGVTFTECPDNGLIESLNAGNRELADARKALAAHTISPAQYDAEVARIQTRFDSIVADLTTVESQQKYAKATGQTTTPSAGTPSTTGTPSTGTPAAKTAASASSKKKKKATLAAAAPAKAITLTVNKSQLAELSLKPTSDLLAAAAPAAPSAKSAMPQTFQDKEKAETVALNTVVTAVKNNRILRSKE